MEATKAQGMNVRSLKYIGGLSRSLRCKLFLIAKAVTLWAQEQEATIGLFEDYSGEIVNGCKDVGFTWNLTEPRE